MGWQIDKKQTCPTCLQPIRGYCDPCYVSSEGSALHSYAQFVWKKQGEDGEVVMTDIMGMTLHKNPKVVVSEDGTTAKFLNADGDVVMTATNINQADKAGEKEVDESLD